MGRFFIFFSSNFFTIFCLAQTNISTSSQLELINIPKYDSLAKLVTEAKEDTAGANLLAAVSYYFAFYRPEKGVAYGQRGIQLSNKIGYKEGIAHCNRSLAMCLWGVGNYSNGLQTGLEALRLYENLKEKKEMAFTYYVLANIYRDFGDYERALETTKRGLEIYGQLNVTDVIGYAIIGSIYDLQDKIDSAYWYVQKSVDLNRGINSQNWGWLNYLRGNIWRKRKQYDSALYFYRAALPLVEEKDVVETYNGIAKLYRATGEIDSSIYYATEVLEKLRSVSYQRGILEATKILADVYKDVNQRDSAIKYLELSITLNNKLYNQENERNIQSMAFNEQLRQDEIIRERHQNLNRLKMYALIGAGLIFLITALLLWRNNRQRKKTNLLLLRQKEKVETTLQELKSAQSQLIQSEKMASLGELTAGIAHEIQNPLNFVNNFAEVNDELLKELRTEAANGNLEEVKAIANDIAFNSEKINFHGKRADSIVKGMLQHSRASSGQKEPTDINALCDEYLRLAYHGLRAKDKSFNAKFETDFDNSIGKINIVPQEIGRVILNLINNSYYAVNEKRKSGIESYEPIVAVSTRKKKDKVEIKVKDNGSGIPQNLMDKIFQPFFTTKPTGQGTGLGLSLAYDIVTKGHGGELKVETKEGEGSEFLIQLPAKTN